MKLTVRHHLDCDADTYWTKVFFDEEYVRRLYLDVLGCTAVEVESMDGTPGGAAHRRLASEQPIDAPGPVKKLIGGTIGYVEDGSFDEATRSWRFRLEPSKLADKIKISGVTTLEPSAGSGAERVTEMDVTVKIFGVGGVFEKFIERQTRESQEKAAAFTNQFVAEKGLA